MLRMVQVKATETSSIRQEEERKVEVGAGRHMREETSEQIMKDLEEKWRKSGNKKQQRRKNQRKERRKRGTKGWIWSKWCKERVKLHVEKEGEERKERTQKRRKTEDGEKCGTWESGEMVVSSPRQSAELWSG